MPYRTCKRCSVARVNILCGLYERAFKKNDKKAEQDLTKLIKLAAARGFQEGRSILTEEMDEAEVRAVCWNVSSVLTDDDLEQLGYKVSKRR